MADYKITLSIPSLPFIRATNCISLSGLVIASLSKHSSKHIVCDFNLYIFLDVK